MWATKHESELSKATENRKRSFCEFFSHRFMFVRRSSRTDGKANTTLSSMTTSHHIAVRKDKEGSPEREREPNLSWQRKEGRKEERGKVHRHDGHCRRRRRRRRRQGVQNPNSQPTVQSALKGVARGGNFTRYASQSKSEIKTRDSS